MTFEQFHLTYKNRVRSYATGYRRKLGLRCSQTADDFEQACWLGVLSALPSWSAIGADSRIRHKSAFNWCAPSMRREMEKQLRVFAGSKPSGTGQIMFLEDSIDFGQFEGIDLDLPALIDLRRAIENDPKPKQVARFVLTAINPNEQATVAVSQKITRQAVCKAVRQTRERLRLALG